MRHALALLLLVLPLSATAQEPDIWPGYAITDEEAATLGRQAMPLTQEQIVLLGRLLQQVRAATAAGAGDIPQALHRRMQIHPGHGDIPQVSLARGYTTAVSFTDITGEPWPIEEVLVDASFVPPQAGPRPDGAQHLFYLAPSRANLHGNAVVKLVGLTDPVILTLIDGAGAADVRLDLRIALPGPAADPSALVRLPPFQAGDERLLDLLAGLPPATAARLVVSGGSPADRAWAEGEDVLLVTTATILSPGPWAAQRSADGRWAYRLPATPFALMTEAGREYRLDFRAEAALATLEEILQ